ncbi:MAG TPA: GNAT family N-acetyltransferase [Pseudonocardiaceae bacterium]|nr:GNAT family N-acetyltransferase [Pseudonocardiaceae bacterium]
MDEMPDPWPLWRLELRTPRLTLRPEEDAGLVELMAEACRGVHAPEEMPFGRPWTDAPPVDMVRNGFKHHWGLRMAFAPECWQVTFLVRYEGRVIGSQSMSAVDFAVTRNVSTGSWIGMRHQGQGLGKEMRAAVLMFAFDHLGATAARSAAFEENKRSLGVSSRLGYERDGTFTDNQRGKPAVQIRQLVTPERFVRPDWKLEVSGLAAALPMLGLA